MKTQIILGILFLAGVANVAEATLIARDLDGINTTAEAYYDTSLDITWLKDANAGAGSVFDNGRLPNDGVMSWQNAMEWADSLSFTVGGDTWDAWRLPNMDVNNDGVVVLCFGGGVPGCEDNEIDHLFWEDGIRADSPGPFTNLYNGYYWSYMDISSGPTGYVNDFFFESDLPWGDGSDSNVKELEPYDRAWAVHSGQVGATVVPLPATIWLFGSGLMWLLGVSRLHRPSITG
jgi:hypothetical protein